MPSIPVVPDSHVTRGIALMVASTLSMSTMYVAIRFVPGEMHPFEVVFFRNFFGLGILLLWHHKRFKALFKTEQLKMHLLRGVLNVVAMLMFFTAVLMTPLAEVAALGFTAPLFASLMALVIFRERLHMHRMVVIAVGFVGVLLILRPGPDALNLGAVLILASAALWAATMLVIKRLSGKDSSATITLYMVVVMAPLSFLAALYDWQTPTLPQLAWFVLISVLGTLGQITLAQSFKLADVTAVLPLDFLKLIWGALLGYLFFSEVPDLFTWVGGILIFSSSTYLALRESRPSKPASTD